MSTGKKTARENMEEWGSSAVVEQETVRAVVKAYGKGEIELPAVHATNPAHIRYAPSFGQHFGPGRSDQQHPYTANTLAEFIGWTEPKGRPQKKAVHVSGAYHFCR